MKRTLQRQVLAAARSTWNPRSRRVDNGAVSVLLTFPADTPAAPVWSPGADFRVCREDRAWIRESPAGTTLVVTDHQQLRTAGQGPPGGREVWTVTVPPGTDHLGFLSDKPHRIGAFARTTPGSEVRREPMSGHPSADVLRHWERFEAQWGFRPRLHLEDGSVPADGRRWLLLPCLPAVEEFPSEWELIEAAAHVARAFGARARVYPYDRARRTLADPVGGAGDVNTVRRILAAAAVRR
ncbi:hypothetical protein [Kitasatospora sp. NPDC093679]|uniref:hypothetical protein n=1 Tax=Kitasatospora sp. NPDC093679 TaxID=3154983 RepID=UPI00341D5DD5